MRWLSSRYFCTFCADGQSYRMALHTEKTALHAGFQIAAGGGFTQSRRARDFVHRKAVQRRAAKEIVYPRQRISGLR